MKYEVIIRKPYYYGTPIHLYRGLARDTRLPPDYALTYKEFEKFASRKGREFYEIIGDDWMPIYGRFIYRHHEFDHRLNRVEMKGVYYALSGEKTCHPTIIKRTPLLDLAFEAENWAAFEAAYKEVV